MFVYVFAIRKKNQVISSKTSLISQRLAAKVRIFTYAVADQTELFGLSLVLDWIFIRSDLVDQTEFWSDLEDETERLSSLEKFMQIRTKTKLWSKN